MSNAKRLGVITALFAAVEALLSPAGICDFVGVGRAAASDLDEFKIKREQVFEFTEKPTVTRDGDNVTIRFASKGYCDVTVAIEDAKGRIVRHLASGVLGANAPEPFQRNSLRQTVVWDGKDDQGRYIDEKETLAVRVSLGLRARFERSLFWSPHKRISSLPIIRAAPEGVYVGEGFGLDRLCLFDHQGDYVRTVYPFPADKLKEVLGLRWHDFPQGYRRPLKESLYQQTLLTSGDNDNNGDRLGMSGQAAVGMAVRGRRIALLYEHLNRLATDGSSGGLPLKGPKTGIVVRKGGYGGYSRGEQIIGPSSVAFAPDGQTVYLTGYLWRQAYGGAKPGCVPAVLKMDYEKDDEPAVFVGSRDLNAHGTDNAHFTVPTSVACDAQGRVYVSDYMNDRVQIFDANGSHLRTLKCEKPAKVLVHQRTGEIFVFSWGAIGIPHDVARRLGFDVRKVRQGLTRFSAMPEARRRLYEEFPLGPGDPGMIFAMGQVYEVEIDSWVDELTFWVVGRRHTVSRADLRANASAAFKREFADLQRRGIRIMRRVDGRWTTVRSFGDEVKKKVVRVRAPRNAIQQLYFNPASEKLYLGEADSGATWKAYKQLIEIDPPTGRIRPVDLPFNALDVAFDQNGWVYLRTTDVVARYDPVTWREIPWDYGSELPKVGSGMFGRYAPVASGLVMPARSPVCFHQGGMSVSPKGNLAVSCHNRTSRKHHSDFGEQVLPHGAPYAPALYPGREESSTSACIHVWDKHGQVLYEDAIRGLPQIDGVHIDRDDNLYVMATPTRIHDGKRYFNDVSSTLMKFRPGEGKVISSRGGPVPLARESWPKRPPDLSRGGVKWVAGAKWFYGGVGFAGFNTSRAGGGCACWFSRFTLDYFARSIAPEPYQFSVAVIDTNGNLILRIGKCGNVDDGKALDPAGGPPSPRSVGGDEVALFHACYVGTHTDRRIFISDTGNGRIVSAKLDYHATEKLPLRGK